MTLRRRLRSAWCVLTGGHRLWWPVAREPYALTASCQRCGHEAVLPLTELRPPRQTYAGQPERLRLERPWQRHLRRVPVITPLDLVVIGLGIITVLDYIEAALRRAAPAVGEEQKDRP